MDLSLEAYSGDRTNMVVVVVTVVLWTKMLPLSRPDRRINSAMYAWRLFLVEFDIIWFNALFKIIQDFISI